MKILVLAFLLIWFVNADICSQNDNTWHQKPELHISGFADIYYVYDFNKPQSSYRQSFLYNQNRHNEFNLNLGLIKLDVEHIKYRANIAFQTGTYANDNYAAEPGLLKNIFEANIGISLNKKNTLWLDAGILPSHIGFESAISMDNWTLTRSLLAENSPYFSTGAKFTFYPSEKWEFAGLILNGWQRIQRLPGNSLLSLGTQLFFKPTKNINLNWSTFLGTDDPDISRRMRYFNNLYGQFQVTSKFGLTAGFDFGAQQQLKGSSNYELWFSPVVIAQYILTKSWKTTIRAEYYQDENGVMIPTNTVHGFQTTGISLNIDFTPSQNILCRLEGRLMQSKDKLFETKTLPTNNNFIIGGSIAISFSETIAGNNVKR